MNQPRATFRAEVPVRPAIRVWTTVNGDGSGVRFFDVKVWKDGGHAVGGGGLVAAFGAVADVEFERLREWGCEGDGAALTVPFHFLISREA